MASDAGRIPAELARRLFLAGISGADEPRCGTSVGIDHVGDANFTDTQPDESAGLFLRQGDYRSAAYCEARAVEYLLARNRISDAETRIRAGSMTSACPVNRPSWPPRLSFWSRSATTMRRWDCCRKPALAPLARPSSWTVAPLRCRRRRARAQIPGTALVGVAARPSGVEAEPTSAAVLAAVTALTAAAGPLLVFDDISADQVFVIGEGDEPADLAAHWPW